jgi:hypothetical protein
VIKKPPVSRTQAPSEFSRILDRALHSISGCRALAFVDAEGEAVEVAGFGEEFDIKVAGAQWSITLQDFRALPIGEIRDVMICAERSSYLVRSLPEGYSLVCVLVPKAAFHVSERALGRCLFELSREAGFESAVRKPRWHPVEVVPCGKRTARPRRLRGEAGWYDLQVLGAIVGLTRRERGYRVRLENGAEVSLVREPLGMWWSDEQL